MFKQTLIAAFAIAYTANGYEIVYDDDGGRWVDNDHDGSPIKNTRTCGIYGCSFDEDCPSNCVEDEWFVCKYDARRDFWNGKRCQRIYNEFGDEPCTDDSECEGVNTCSF